LRQVSKTPDYGDLQADYVHPPALIVSVILDQCVAGDLRVLTNQLDGKPDCDRLLLADCTYLMGRDHGGRVSLSTTARALRHAAACGIGSGGSCGAKGGVSGISTTAVDLLRITDRLHLLRAKSCREERRNAISAERRHL
jgi:hypothetical protein